MAGIGRAGSLSWDQPIRARGSSPGEGNPTLLRSRFTRTQIQVAGRSRFPSRYPIFSLAGERIVDPFASRGSGHYRPCRKNCRALSCPAEKYPRLKRRALDRGRHPILSGIPESYPQRRPGKPNVPAPVGHLGTELYGRVRYVPSFWPFDDCHAASQPILRRSGYYRASEFLYESDHLNPHVP